MKLNKRSTALLLSVVLMVGLLALPAGAASDVSTFTDITDPTVGMAVEVLRTMGVLDGTGGGRFEPEGKLTRGEFAKMAVTVMGKGGEADAYTRQTIFKDVTSTHWARGYINLAYNTKVGGTRLLQGTGESRFEPDRPILYDEAVTVLLRMLGYGQQVDSNLPFSARSLAASLKLDAKLGSFTPDGPITRGQAAILFLNALTAAGTSASVLDLGTPTAGVILTSVSDRAASLLYSDGTVVEAEPAVNMPASFLVGRRGTVYLDGSKRLRAFIPDERDTHRDVVVQSADALGITELGGARLPVASNVTVIRDGERYEYGVKEFYKGLDRPGLMLTVYYTASGAVDFILVRGAGAVSGETAVAAADGVGAFDAITNVSRTCRVIKNGAVMSLAELRKLDVGVFDATSNTLYVTDFRITALYEGASPNPYAPTSVTLFGTEFEVLPAAVPDFENVKIGEMALFLFSPDGKIAGVRRQYDAPSTAIGIVRPGSTSDNVTVDLLNAPLKAGENGSVTLSAAVSGSVDRYLGRLVSLSGGFRRKDGKVEPLLNLTTLSSSGSAGALDVAARTVGTLALADNAVVLEKVGESALTPISLSDIPFKTVPASQVTFIHRDAAGKVDILVLDDVTGDRYTYGLRTEKQETTDSGTPFGNIENTATVITYGEGESLTVIGDYPYDDAFGGAVKSMVTIGNQKRPRSAGFARLTAAEGATQANFDLTAGTFTYGGFTIPIAGVVRCYNEASGTWYDSLPDALLRSNSFTVYYDRTPETGAKVRVVVAH